MRYGLSIFSALTILSFCSCATTQPKDPFAETQKSGLDHVFMVPQEQGEEPWGGVFSETNPEVLILQQEYRPLYTPLPAPQPGRLTPKQPDNTIRLVAFLEENDGPQSQRDEITIDPHLQEQGAKIVAEQQNGQEVFQGAWRPPGVAGFWPQQEYLADGGDGHTKVIVKDDWTVLNLYPEDTVAHYMVDGRVLIEPSNRVHLYAPRFGSVRKIEGVLGSGQITVLDERRNQVELRFRRGEEGPGRTAQETSAGYARSQTQLGGIASRKASTGAATTQGLGEYEGVNAAQHYANRITQMSVGGAELAYLAEDAASARAWQDVEGVKVRIGSQTPMAATSEEGAESFFQVKLDGNQSSMLRLIKVASKKSAQPGEIVEFTLRFDNVGTLPIGNVTILDNLTTRLEYIEGSAKSSLPTGFIVEPNIGGSFTLRWEITDALKPLQFGVVQFQCRVR